MIWDESIRKLTIGARKGNYKGMTLNRKFTAILPDGHSKTISYSGKKISVIF